MTARAVSLGDDEADLVVRNGRVFRPESAEFVLADLAVVDGRVAAQLEDRTTGPVVGDDTTVVDASGQHVVPGFVDAHTHVDTIQTLGAAYPHHLAGGTTSLVAELNGFQLLFGVPGVEALLDVAADIPVAVRFVVSPLSLVDTFEEPRPVDTGALCDLLARPEVCGVGEFPWIHAVGRESGAEELFERARQESKPISAHGAGCRGGKLQALAGVVDNDHEAISAEGFQERVRAGSHAIARSGSVRDDAPAFGEAYEEFGRTRIAEFSLATDGTGPGSLLEEGHMDAVLRRVIDAGVAPADAFRLATLNPARHFGLDGRGTLAPGSVADIVVLDDVETVAVDTVVAGGEVVVRDGEPLVEPRSHSYPDYFYDAVDVSLADDACLVSAGAAVDGRVRAIEHRRGLVTAETTVQPGIDGKHLVPDPATDALKLVHVDRHPDGDGDAFAGFLTGYGLESGAAATTLTWDTTSLVGVGADDADLGTAMERVIELDGGGVVVEDGDVVAELALPIGGRSTDRPLAETAQRLDDIETALRSRGVTADRPLLAVQTITFVGVPALKLGRTGYADVTGPDVVGLAPDAGAAAEPEHQE
jgi:adenine deaminase